MTLGKGGGAHGSGSSQPLPSVLGASWSGALGGNGPLCNQGRVQWSTKESSSSCPHNMTEYHLLPGSFQAAAFHPWLVQIFTHHPLFCKTHSLSSEVGPLDLGPAAQGFGTGRVTLKHHDPAVTLGGPVIAPLSPGLCCDLEGKLRGLALQGIQLGLQLCLSSESPFPPCAVATEGE